MTTPRRPIPIFCPALRRVEPIVAAERSRASLSPVPFLRGISSVFPRVLSEAMIRLLLLPLFSVVLGQGVVRLTAKSGLPLPVVLATKFCVATLLVQGFVGSVFDAFPGDSGGSVVVLDLWLRLLLLSLGLLVGEYFCPIALTGSIATGKSTVARLFLSATQKPNEKDDVYLIDSDTIGHEILLPPRVLKTTSSSIEKTETEKGYSVLPSESVYDKICEAFPDDLNDFLDPKSGLIVRRKLGTVVFSNDQRRKTLNSITHPRIIQILIKRILYGVYVKRVPICCADVPLLFESGMLRLLFCLTVVVATNPDVQYQRLRQRNTDLSEEDCRNRIKSQYPMERKVAAADVVIWNNGSVDELEDRVRKIKAGIKRRLCGGLSLGALVLVVGVPTLIFGYH